MTSIATAASSIDVSVDADTVWQLIGGFGTPPDWLPFIASGELGEGGRTRRLTTTDGDVFVERLVAFDDALRTYTYTIAHANFPVTDYLSTLRVTRRPNGAGSRVIWSGQFIPDGVGAAEATGLFQKMYDNGLTALASRYETGAEDAARA